MDKLFTAKEYERMRLEMGIPVADSIADIKNKDGDSLIEVVEELPATPSLFLISAMLSATGILKIKMEIV